MFTEPRCSRSSRRTLLKTTAVRLRLPRLRRPARPGRREKAANPLAPKQPHFPARAKRVIFLCMEGGPSHVDTFDYKPKLTADDGKPFAQGRFAGAKLLASPWKFAQHGQSGLWISELFPEVAKHADDLCVAATACTPTCRTIRRPSCRCTPASSSSTRPSLGAWALYGLGTENENLPGFVTICPPLEHGGPANYGSAFLPAIYQGTPIGGSSAGPVAGGHASATSRNPRAVAAGRSATQLDFVQALNRDALERDQVNPGVEGVIESYELAFRMQGEVPKLMDLSNESAATQAAVRHRRTDDRRLRPAVPAGPALRRGGRALRRGLLTATGTSTATCKRPARPQRAGDGQADRRPADRPQGARPARRTRWSSGAASSAARRTPRTATAATTTTRASRMWMAGGGVKGGLAYGQTDDYGYEAVEDKVHIHDWHATILHLLGLDHEKLTYRYAGRDMRLTDVKGNVVKDIVA